MVEPMNSRVIMVFSIWCSTMKYGQNTFKKSKDKAVPGKRSFEYLWKSSCLLLPSTLFCHCISSKAFLRLTSLGKRFELIQIFKALTTGCDVGF